MLRLAICDDEPALLRELERILEEARLELDWEIFESGEALLAYQERSGERFHIYLLDIEMPGRGGIDTAAALRDWDREAVILFLTGHREYVYQVFEVLPFRFLRKPVGPRELVGALEAAMGHVRRAGQLFFYRVGREVRQCPYAAIRYFEGAGRKVILHSDGGQETFYGRMADVWEELDHSQFTRPHASFVVNMERIRSIRTGELLLADGGSIPVSKGYRTRVKEDHLRFVARRSGG